MSFDPVVTMATYTAHFRKDGSTEDRFALYAVMDYFLVLRDRFLKTQNEQQRLVWEAFLSKCLMSQIDQNLSADSSFIKLGLSFI